MRSRIVEIAVENDELDWLFYPQLRPDTRPFTEQMIGEGIHLWPLCHTSGICL